MEEQKNHAIKIAQLQMPVFTHKEDSLAYLKEAFERAAEQRPDMITLPEMFCCPYDVKNFPLYAEEERGQVWEACSALALKYGIYLQAGTMPELDREGRIYNTAYVFDRKGKQIAKHRKAHLFDIDVKGGQSFKESETLTVGDAVTVFKTEFGTFGLCVCYDFRFPEMGRLMALSGAWVILVPAAFNMTTGPMHWELMFCSQAVNNQVYTVGTAPARDMNASYHSWGHSIVADPWGKSLQMDEKEGMQISELNPGTVEEVRQQLPLLKHRREDIYKVVGKYFG